MADFESNMLKRKAVAALLLATIIDETEGRGWKRGKTREWMKRREERGYCSTIVRELQIEDCASYKEMMRMEHEQFLEILKLIEKDITPQQILGGQKVISPMSRLTLTLRFLATGETYRSMAYQFRISKAAISYIINEVCLAIVKEMVPLYLRTPQNAEEWKAIAKKFEEKWQFPNCLGAIDGKHIVMQPPSGSGSKYFNYKHTHSIVLLAVAGPNYECLYADVGTNGRVSDGGVWGKCSLAHKLENDKEYLPEPECLPSGTEKCNYVIVGDEAFPLKPYLMKPFPQAGLDDEKRVYNYRHSRARRISENLFGIIANRWRVFSSIILLPPATIEKLTMATLAIHNFLRQSTSKTAYCPHGFLDSSSSSSGEVIPGQWRKSTPTESFFHLQVSQTGNNPSNSAKEVGELFKGYFCNEGAVSWQWQKC